MKRAGPVLDAEAVLALAHALRTPLTSLGLDDEHPAVHGAPRPRSGPPSALPSSSRALHTDHLGAYAGPVERVPIDAATLVQRALAPLAPQAAAQGVALSAVLAPRVRVVADPVKLVWVLASLIGNALRFSAAGGVVQVTLARSARGAEFRIQDEGPGVAPEVSEQLFERASGRGFTLVLVREIVEAHGGQIYLAQDAPRGC